MVFAVLGGDDRMRRLCRLLTSDGHTVRPFALERALPEGPGILLTNPPYGDRLLDAAQAEALYRGMGRAWRGEKDWRFYVLTSSLDFEKSFGRRAAKRRKLYNGSIPCQLYMYF